MVQYLSFAHKYIRVIVNISLKQKKNTLKHFETSLSNIAAKQKEAEKRTISVTFLLAPP